MEFRSPFIKMLILLEQNMWQYTGPIEENSSNFCTIREPEHNKLTFSAVGSSHMSCKHTHLKSF